MSRVFATALFAMVGVLTGGCADACDESEPDHRAGAMAESCRGCHEEHVRFWRYGAHATVSCAVCHGVDGDHILTKTTPRRPRPGECLDCHAFGPKSGARTLTETEMLEHHLRRVEQEHVIEVDRGKVGNRCVSCHDPHRAQ